MQKLVRDYLNELKRKQKKRKRVGTAVVLLVILVIGTVIGGLTQAGVAMTGNAKCGIEEHEHSDGCYENILACGQEEGEGHQHGDGCYETQSTLTCGMEEEEGHQHDESCYDEAGNLICGTEEAAGHQHDDSCYTTEEVLTCEQEEGEGHSHSDACYEKELACKKEEHTHTEECYIDRKADVEESSKWDEQYKDTEWKETWAENLVIAAEAQIGYKESEDNYEAAEDGSHKGYTRYGQFMDDVYADWDAAFVNFCMHYAGKDDFNIEASGVFPKEIEAVKWYEEFIGADEKNMSYLVAPQGYEPKAGDLVFFDRKDETPAFQMGIVSSYDEEKNEIKVIEGNSDNEVKENEYGIRDEDIEENHIFGYLKMDEVEEAYEASGKTAEEDADQKEDVNTEQPQEEIKELTTEVDGTTITLSGPVSSFEEGKEYSIQAEKVENKETIATIEEAIDQVAEEKEKKVENYQAFDIKLMVDGEEVQPLGPVEVKFSSREVAKSVEDEATEVNVIHVDENTGKATDMEADTETLENDSIVTMQTTHFSIYVIVDLGDISGKSIEVKLQHWGTVETIDSDDTTNPYHVGLDTATDSAGRRYGYYTKDDVYDRHNQVIKKLNYKGELYRADSIRLENLIEGKPIEELSKLCLAASGTVVDTEKYEVEKIWISDDLENEELDEWKPGTFTEYEYEKDSAVTKKIKLQKDSVIRFWYKERQPSEYNQAVTFYDHNVSDGGSDKGTWQGTNTSTNFGDGQYKMQAGQNSSGNLSDADSQHPLDCVKAEGIGYLNRGNRWNEVTPQCTIDSNAQTAMGEARYWAVPVRGLVKEQLTSDFSLQFADTIAQPGFFTSAKGNKVFSNYQLGFQRTGDTYVLSNVKRNGSKVLTDLENIKYSAHSNVKTANSNIYSNEFWPLDDESYSGMDSRRTNGSDDGKTHNWHFGMRYSFQFSIGDYTGPMNYYFRGDDDFWLFVDGKLAVNLGGIHSAVGHAIDLRKWMTEQGLLDPSDSIQLQRKMHRIDVFYMERGGFGSCCYMQFTLPNCSEVKSQTTEDHTSLSVQKEWIDDEKNYKGKDIEVNLVRTSSEGIVTKEKRTLNEKNGWRYVWDDLPVEDINNENIKYTYSVEEVTKLPGYKMEITSGTGGSVYNYTITNTKVMDIPVQKEWEDLNNQYEKRPGSVTVKLLADNETVKKDDGTEWLLTLSDTNNWKDQWTALPVYKKVGGKVSEIVYNVEEVSNDGLKNYSPTYSQVPGGIGESKFKFVITNTIKQEWKLIKRNANNPAQILGGAEFTLKPTNLSGTTYIGTSSEETGIITWKAGGDVVSVIAPGEYTLSETKAPTGFALNEEQWKVKIGKNGVLETIPNINNSTTSIDYVKGETADGTITITCYYGDTMLYELPSTGGSGIYWYMFGGVLLMAGAMLITYRNKRKEVLRS